MSTNYYFASKKSREANQALSNKLDQIFKKASTELVELGYADASDILEDVRWRFEREEYSIHIGKRSSGWKPIFEAGEHFKSMSEMKKWYSENKNKYIIENEYSEELNWSDLQNELFDWNGEKTHIGNPFGYHYKDDDGYEWAHGEFS